MSRKALVLLVCCCDFRDGAERLIPSKSLGNAVIRAFPGLFRILRMCAPRHAAAVVRPRERKKSADRRRRILISRLLIIRASVPRRKSPFPAYFKGFPAVSLLIPPYPAFLKYPVSPQSFSAAAATVKNLASFPRALVVDIGGFTADYVRLRNGVPDMAACDSLENGVILLYNRICAKANAELDILLEESEIDRILRGEDQDAAPEVIALAEREAQEFINDLLSGLRERMLELKSGKVIFLGGGATLLRRQIEASGKTGQAIFVEDINANAKGYEYLYRLQHSGR